MLTNSQPSPPVSSSIGALPPNLVFDKLQSRPTGLSYDEVQTRLSEFGTNSLNNHASWHSLERLVHHLVNFFSLLLYLAGGMCLLADAMQPGENMALLGWMLLLVSLMNAVFSFFQEYRAERAMAELRKYLPQMACVRRSAQEVTINAEEIVPGDVLIVREGEQITADARVVISENLLANNAPLTGESRSIALRAEGENRPFADSSNLLFAGCSIMRGSGEAVVFATGQKTQFGNLAAVSSNLARPTSPLQRETQRMIRTLTVIAFAMGILFFIYGWVIGRSWWTNVVFMLGIIVANVPEGLLPTLTLALSLASQRMARKNVLVKNLESVETLGAIHVICTDKTGTLTKNELALASAFDGVRGEPLTPGVGLESILLASLVASTVHGTSSRWEGDPLDVVIVQKYADICGDPRSIITSTRRHFPFDLKKRREAGIYETGQKNLFATKGAWEALRPYLKWIQEPETGDTFEIDPERLNKCNQIVRDLCATGARVIAVATRVLTQLDNHKLTADSLEEDLTLQGFLAFHDPLRDDVQDSVACCHSAGIRVVMVTGDHRDTAVAVATKCGILSPDAANECRVMTGEELETLSETEILRRLNGDVRVFARTLPEQKLKLVQAYSTLGLVVGMTGDGVNDAPALKAANVGIAMGVGGTDVAREAADIVLLDNSFTSLVEGIKEGRNVFRNIQKFITYVLASNVPEILPYLLYIVFPVPLALTIVQILAIDLGTDLLPAIGLGQEKPESDTMDRPPRSLESHLLSPAALLTSYLFLGMIEAGFSLALFFFVLIQGGWQWGQELGWDDPLYRSATGITLATVVLMQIGNVISRRSSQHLGIDRDLLRNTIVLIGIALEVAFAVALLYWRPLQALLGTGAVPFSVFIFSWLGIPLMLGLDRCRKYLFHRRLAKQAKKVAANQLT